MEMFNPAVAKERIGHLKKSDALNPLRDVERYFLKQAKKYGIDTSYDVLAGEIPQDDLTKPGNGYEDLLKNMSDNKYQVNWDANNKKSRVVLLNGFISIDKNNINYMICATPLINNYFVNSHCNVKIKLSILLIIFMIEHYIF